ncbi:alpha-methylacyl-CoA racemase [Sphingopyxis sp. YR583]|uniref:CaiB/BaiF CoA transferase family protein n=1 Tax=Sphingopyxis sp. YR583 TaxID=1881047 RepID=UPI0008A7ECF2|nr:CaiB/BaiF CoA-transferase family protein [Sphingopyxis sp. YR583]SEH19181.1 alpha-methylacyl-CoA racemase [Sphingopyxis sp. YR583]
MSNGPLAGIRIIEFAGIGPGPFCGMLLSDLGADVLRIDRKSGNTGPGPGDDSRAVTNRGRRSVALDLKRPEAIDLCLTLIEKADALFEGYRPGVMERLGLGPDVAHGQNPSLVYGRLSGWGQDGPLSKRAGHDINYIALSGALHSIGTKETPVPPLNLVGDFGGGSLYMALGLLAGILHSRATGVGQTIDCAINETAISLMSMFYGYRAMGRWTDDRGENLLDGGAHFYNSYKCRDGKWIAIGPIEPQFYEILRDAAGLTEPIFDNQMDQTRWPTARARMAKVFATKSRADWCDLLESVDACFAPILSLGEAPRHPHHIARGSFVDIEGVVQPAPIPRFSATPGRVRHRPPRAGEHNETALADWGIDIDRRTELIRSGAM